MKRLFADLMFGIFVLALVYLLVRPRSGAVDAVRLVGDAIVSVVAAATDY